MATTVDHLGDGYSLLASRRPALTARFVNDALPYLNQLNDRARGLTCNAVDAEDLLQETILRAYAGFDTFCEGTNLQVWLFRIMIDTYINGLRRAQHRPSEYLCDHNEVADALVTPPAMCREGTVMSSLRRGRLRLRILVRTTHGPV